MESLIKLKGVPEELMELLIREGYFKTKTEVVRAGIIALGKEFNLLKSPEDIEERLAAIRMKEMEEEVKSGRVKTVSLKEMAKRRGINLNELRD